MANMEVPELVDPEIAWLLLPLALLILLLFILALCDGWPDGAQMIIDDHLRPLFIQRHDGTYAQFRKGPDKIDRKTASERTMQADLENSRAHIYSQLLRTAPSKVWKSCALSGVFTLGMSWCIVNGIYYEHFELTSIFRNMEAANMLFICVLPLTSGMLAWYVGLRLYKFGQVVGHVGDVTGALEGIALVVGAAVRDRAEDEDMKEAMWILYRHLNLVHILIYMQVSVRFDHHNLHDLQLIGYISEAERISLDEAIDPSGLATFWIGHFIMDLHHAQAFDVDILSSLMRNLSDLRSATQCLVQEVKRISPMSFVQLIQSSIDMLFLLTTPVLIHKFLLGRAYQEGYVFMPGTSTHTSSTTTTTSTTTSTMTGVHAMAMMFTYSRVSIYMMPVVGSILVTVLYQGSFQIVKDTEDPFGIGMDRLNPDIILDLAEKRIARYLRKSSDNLPSLALGPKQVVPEELKDDSGDESPLPMREGTEGINVDITSPFSSPRRERRDSDASGSASSATAAAAAYSDRQKLPTAVVLSQLNIDALTSGAHQDARDLHRGVEDKLTRLELDLLQKLEEDDPYLVAVTELLAKLQQDSATNAQLREQVISAVSGMSRVEQIVLENPSAQRRARNKDPLSEGSGGQVGMRGFRDLMETAEDLPRADSDD